MGFFTLLMLIMCHVTASLWIMLSQFDERNWLKLRIQDYVESGEDIDIEKDKVKQYFIALYFVIQTISTVGYGDVNPQNTKERIFVIGLMIVGVLAFSFISGQLSSILLSYDQQVQKNLESNMRLSKIFNNF